jgi:transposase-like protein
MKDIYGAPNGDATELALEALAKKWNSKYSYAIKRWRKTLISLLLFFTSQWKSEKLFTLLN